jgi:hypothetical protein
LPELQRNTSVRKKPEKIHQSFHKKIASFGISLEQKVTETKTNLIK